MWLALCLALAAQCKYWVLLSPSFNQEIHDLCFHKISSIRRRLSRIQDDCGREISILFDSIELIDGGEKRDISFVQS